MTKRTRWAATAYEDCGHWSCDGIGCAIGVVRCLDGDTEAWEAGVRFVKNCTGMVDDFPINPPEWAWYRWNPDGTRTYPLILARADGPGYGNWRGAQVVTAPHKGAYRRDNP